MDRLHELTSQEVLGKAIELMEDIFTDKDYFIGLAMDVSNENENVASALIDEARNCLERVNESLGELYDIIFIRRAEKIRNGEI